MKSTIATVVLCGLLSFVQARAEQMPAFAVAVLTMPYQPKAMQVKQTPAWFLRRMKNVLQKAEVTADQYGYRFSCQAQRHFFLAYTNQSSEKMMLQLLDHLGSFYQFGRSKQGLLDKMPETYFSQRVDIGYVPPEDGTKSPIAGHLELHRTLNPKSEGFVFAAFYLESIGPHTHLYVCEAEKR